MKKKLLLLCGIGAALGVTLSLLIAILISLTVGDGGFWRSYEPDCRLRRRAERCDFCKRRFSMLYGAASGVARR